jgi:hypothetical protein
MRDTKPPVAGVEPARRGRRRFLQQVSAVTDERVVAFVERCERMGINARQTGLGASDKIVRAVRALRERGSRIHWFCLASEDEGQRPLGEVVALEPIAVVHHGGVTDRLFRAGQAEKVHDFVKKAHDAGVLAGVSSHNPDNVAFVEEKGWENDFFMTCFYNVTRPAEEIRAKLGTVPLGEPFLESDREAMSAVVRQVKRPCLKYAGAGVARLTPSAGPVPGATG